MNKPPQHSVNRPVDSIQQRLTSYACDLTYTDLSPEAIHAAKVRVIDTLGALVGGFFGEPCRILRNLVVQTGSPGGATVIGTRLKTTPDIAAFANGTTTHYMEMHDIYHRPGTGQGRPSGALTPILAVAEQAQVSGPAFITSVVLAYEVMLRISDVFHNAESFDHTNFVCLGSAVGSGKVLGLSPSQLSHCISMAVVPNNILRQVRSGHLSMYKATATGQAGRAGVFAALLARQGMEGPHLPFEGKAGWCAHVARERFSLDIFGGGATPFKILETQIKTRAADSNMVGCILAAEKVAPLDINEVKQVTVEIYQHAMRWGTDEHLWKPESREVADHSIPYNVAATLMDGTVTLHSFDDAHLRSPDLHALMQKIKVVENAEFTLAFERMPQQHRARVTIVTGGGERLVGESGGDQDDLSSPKTDAQIEQKFRGLTEDFLGAKRVQVLLDRLWHLENMHNVAEIPSAFVLG